jgi:prephenate dehydrogenase
VKQVGIVGLGLIGGSLALAIRRARPGEFRVLGYTRTAANAERASRMGIVDEVADSPVSAVTGAELAIVATPISATRDIFQQIAGCLPSGCIVTDVCSTKTEVMEWAEECLPQDVRFVGGHPMAGKETSGIEGAEVGLFDGCTYCLIPGERTSPESLQWMTDFVQGIGARPLVISASEHDEFVAGVSHLPFFVAAALVSATSSTPGWSQMSQLAAGGYRDTTRLALQNPQLGRDMCLTNQRNILWWIDNFAQQLGRFRDVIAADPKAVEGMLMDARRARQQWLEEHAKND